MHCIECVPFDWWQTTVYIVTISFHETDSLIVKVRQEARSFSPIPWQEQHVRLFVVIVKKLLKNAWSLALPWRSGKSQSLTKEIRTIHETFKSTNDISAHDTVWSQDKSAHQRRTTRKTMFITHLFDNHSCTIRTPNTSWQKSSEPETCTLNMMTCFNWTNEDYPHSVVLMEHRIHIKTD